MVLFNLVLAALLSFMPWKTGDPPPNGDAGDGGAGGDSGDGGPPADPPPAPSGKPPVGRMFSQEDLDKVVQERLARESKKYSDYDALKAKAEKFDALEESQKTEVQKAQERAVKAETKAAESEAKADAKLIVAEIKVLSAGKVHDADLVTRLLAGDTGIKVEGDSVTGVKEALDKLLKDHPYLKVGAGPSRSGGQFIGSEAKNLDEQIAEAIQKKDWSTANRLQMQKLRAQQA